MSKRTEFPRQKHDLYNTPFLAALPLFKHLHGVLTFAEPCFGEGQLHRWLTIFGLECRYYGDIQTGQDAIACSELDAIRYDAIITNPPYTWPILREMLERFPKLAPTWLLLEADFASNLQSVEFMRQCTDVVPVGRVKWFTGTKHSSYENYCWFRFAAQHYRGPMLHTIEKIDRRALAKLPPVDAFKQYLGQ